MIAGIPDIEFSGDESIEITQLEYDSRLIKNGGLFFAISGYRQDGHEFLKNAKENGAVAAVGQKKDKTFENYIRVKNSRKILAEIASRFYGNPGEKIKVCGVTGTNGKTTTCYMLQNILEARNKTTGLVTTQLYDTGKEKFAAERTTPESLDLQRLLFLMKKNNCVNAVVEVSSHALMLHRVDNVNFRVAVYTNLTRDHLDFHSSMEEYFEAKALLVKKLTGPLSYAVINLDVPEFKPLFSIVASSYISYSLENDQADVYCSRYEFNPEHTIFDLVSPLGTHTVKIHLPGRFNLMNALAAIAGGLACGVDIDNVINGIESCRPVDGRLNLVDSGQPFAVYVDFAHTPDALTRLCETIREISNGKLLLLFGCGGDRDKGKRPLMGKAATTFADYTVVTTDNPRTEEPDKIVEDIKPGLSGDYEIILDRKEAIQTIIKRASEGDVVLLAGKGSETYQEINNNKEPFSDIEEAQYALAALGYRKQEQVEGS